MIALMPDSCGEMSSQGACIADTIEQLLPTCTSTHTLCSRMHTPSRARLGKHGGGEVHDRVDAGQLLEDEQQAAQLHAARFERCADAHALPRCALGLLCIGAAPQLALACRTPHLHACKAQSACTEGPARLQFCPGSLCPVHIWAACKLASFLGLCSDGQDPTAREPPQPACLSGGKLCSC